MKLLLRVGLAVVVFVIIAGFGLYMAGNQSTNLPQVQPGYGGGVAPPIASAPMAPSPAQQQETNAISNLSIGGN